MAALVILFLFVVALRFAIGVARREGVFLPKGRRGELRVQRTLEALARNPDYHILHDITLPTHLGGTTQIDHLVISPFGLFVIETKNYSGWIFGREHDPQWTQKIHAKHSQKFQNPLRQNYAHTQALARLLGLNPEHLMGLVVFAGDSTFKTPMPPTVMHHTQLLNYILSCTVERLSRDDMTRIVAMIEQQRLAPSHATEAAHIANLQARHRQQQPSPTPSSARISQPPPVPSLPPPIPVHAKPVPPPLPAHPQPCSSALDWAEPEPSNCPNCGLPLVRRTAIRGTHVGREFLTCTGYPQCHFIITPEPC